MLLVRYFIIRIYLLNKCFILFLIAMMIKSPFQFICILVANTSK